MANEKMRMSAAGISALRLREGAVLTYYNDVANNCTYGVGTLVHLAPCSVEELKRPVSLAEVHTELAIRVRDVEAAVRKAVRRTPLTQAQFDALVSFTFNTGVGGARLALNAADRGDFEQVARP